MKKIFILLLLATGISFYAGAQRVQIRLDFPVGIAVRPAAPAPFRGAIWIGPEWRWQSGRYVAVPGYWSRPHRHRAVWIDGYWRHTRRGYVWVPGYWR